MVNLIGNEIKKVFSRWSIKIMILIAIVILIIQIVAVKYLSDFDEIYYASSDSRQFYEEEIKNLNPENEEERDMYIDAKTNLEFIDLQDEYKDQDKWKKECIAREAYDYIYSINCAKYGAEKSSKELDIALEEYENFLEVLKNNDWRAYTKSLLTSAKAELEINKKSLEKATSLDKKQLEQAVELKEFEVEVLQLRLDKNIPYDDSYMDEALDTYSNQMSFVIQNQSDEDTSHQAMIDEIKADAMIAKYSLDTEKDLYNHNNASTVYKEYMISTAELILIVIIITVAGSIISDEFNKGTIKQLLIRPYKRETIWIAKFLSFIIVTIISVLIIGAIAALILGIAFSFKDFATYEVGVYDYNTGSAFSMNVFVYVGIMFISKLPFLIMLGTIAIFVSTLLNNSALAVAVPLLGTIAAEIVNVLLQTSKKFRFLKFFITPNWDWSVYNFGKPSEFEFLNFKFSIAVYMVYFIVLVGLSLLRFKKEDIKNI